MTESDTGKPERSRRSVGQIARLVTLILAATLVLVLVLQNQEPVQTRFLGWSVEMPRFLLLAVVYGLGIVTGWFVRWRGGR